jgi:cobalt-zinc-cadmium efflux system protein
MPDFNRPDIHKHGFSSVRGINLFIILILKVFIIISEVIGGLFAGSLSLVSDALHNLSDVLSILLREGVRSEF